MSSYNFVAVVFFLSIFALPCLLSGWWLFNGIKRSPVKRGILACLLAWTVWGGISVNQQIVNQQREQQNKAAFTLDMPDNPVGEMEVPKVRD